MFNAERRPALFVFFMRGEIKKRALCNENAPIVKTIHRCHVVYNNDERVKGKRGRLRLGF
jgi:hypothetical protein